MDAGMNTKATVPDGLDTCVLARVIEDSYGQEVWPGPDLKAALTGVTSEVAFWRPAPGRQSIAEIALLHAYCTHMVRGQLAGTPPEPFVLERKENDWFALPDEGS